MVSQAILDLVSQDIVELQAVQELLVILVILVLQVLLEAIRLVL